MIGPLDAAGRLAEGFEGFSATPYRDPGGVWTIGDGSTRDAAGNPIGPDTPAITGPEALALLERDMRAALETVRADVRVPLTGDETAALADFVYNVGAGAFGASTLLRLLNAGNYEAAADQLDRWVFAGGRVLAGLVRRRAAERALFLQPTTET